MHELRDTQRLRESERERERGRERERERERERDLREVVRLWIVAVPRISNDDFDQRAKQYRISIRN